MIVNMFLRKITKFQHLRVYNYVTGVKKSRGGHICPPPPDQIGLSNDLLFGSI